MNVGRTLAGAIVASAAVAGAFLWYTAERAYYVPVSFAPGAEIRLVSVASGQAEPILVNGINGVDAESSPIKFRACFTTPTSLATLTETYEVYPSAEPLNAPSNFPCFDAEAIGKALHTGEAVAFLSEPEIHKGVDRVVAVFPDGRAFAWQQLNDTYKD
ncbi:MAG: histidine kinase [Tabrizicola sp.]|nr:histidine kinase [Tabrizicola sp.]